MKFTKNTVTIGRGRVSGARRTAKGDTLFTVEESGVLVLKRIPAGSKMPVFEGLPTVVSYGDDCLPLDGGFIDRRGGFSYVPY